MTQDRFALVTGGSTGIGRCLAQLAAEDGHDLLIVSDDSGITRMDDLSKTGVAIETLSADLSMQEGVDALLDRLGPRCPDLFFANAGRGLGRSFLEQDPDDILKVLGTNVLGTTMLTHEIAGRMVRRGSGRILMTGSIAGNMPGTFQAVYNATKAYVNSLAAALARELEGTGVTVTCLEPGPTETQFFQRAGMCDTPVGQGPKDDPEMVARAGYEALMSGRPEVVSGWKNKAQAAMSHITPKAVLAGLHRKMAKPQDE
ncbi:SDR family NAD(P)-dependent oxidoreductase [Paracoccus rhizosphaerae]|uniref:SDR family NAD(P)-dependent oxidoreductase n=1 Tax=Paracoccus rhizosphaerae TaxID=1133347 RepID=A0ABV6CEJ5_9RHOB|nr:SDR family NAD(P)-dependent oxidoreductase [Paracoccus rhizosphaerae]